MTRVWRIVSEAWRENGDIRIEREVRLRNGLLYRTLAGAVDDGRTKAFVVAEEPGMGSNRVEWDEIKKPYHVIVNSGAEELPCFDDLDVAEMAMRLWMTGH